MRALVRLVIWAALISLGGWLSIPIPGVPLSLQTFFLIMAGLAEGPKGGAMAGGLYLLAGILGLPVFAGGLAGPAIFMQPSAGFALAFPLGAALAGLASRRARQSYSFARAFLAAAAGSMTILLLGFAGLLINTGLDAPAAAALTAAFIPGDLAKSAAAASIVSAKFFGRLG
jgi:biotin transport system substrate-specific component